VGREAAPERGVAIANVVTVLALLGVIGLVGATTSFQWRQERPREAGIAAARVDAGTLPASVPVRRVGGHILVDVALGPHGPSVPMLLDSGSPTMLAPDLAAQLDAEPIGAARVTSLSGSWRDVEVVRIDELHIGRARFTDVPATVGALSAEGPLTGIGAQGIVGADLLAGVVWQMDYRAGRLTIASDTAGLDSIDGAARLPARPASGLSPLPLVELGLDGSVRPALLDTGSDAGLLVAADLLDPARRPGPPRTAHYESWDGRHSVATRPVLVEVTLSELAPRLVAGVALDGLAPDTVLLGNDFLDDYVLTIDGPNQGIHLFPTFPYTLDRGGPGGGP
jgi:hypothetical protein